MKRLVAAKIDHLFNESHDDLDSPQPRYIHQVGHIAKVKWIAHEMSPYTGLFEGSDTGLVRCSLAFAKTAGMPPICHPMTTFKFLRDGCNSSSLFAQFSADGQPGTNFFGRFVCSRSPHVPHGSRCSLVVNDPLNTPQFTDV